MSNKNYTPNPVAGSGVQLDNADSNTQNTLSLQVAVVQAGLLRGLFSYPATRVLEIATTVEQEDFPDAAYRTIMHTLTHAAHALVTAGEGDRVVSAAVIQVDLHDRGELSHGVTASALLEVTTGNPSAWHDVQQLAAALRMNRLRRTVGDVGTALVAAADGSVAELVTALHHVTQLAPLARRAGLEVTL